MRFYTSFLVLVVLLAAPIRGHSAVTNFVTNGSFANNFTGWTVSTGSGAVNPGSGPQIITTDGVTKGPYGDVIVSDNAISPYPNADKGGSTAVYFVDDVATESLTQMITLAAGTYEVGFDLYETPSGAGNTYDSFFSATVANVTILASEVGKFTAGVWQHFAGNVTVSSSGTYAVKFLFQGGAAPAKDLVVDDVYVLNPSTLPGKGVVVPEPAGLGVLLAGLAALGLVRRRRR